MYIIVYKINKHIHGFAYISIHVAVSLLCARAFCKNRIIHMRRIPIYNNIILCIIYYV